MYFNAVQLMALIWRPNSSTGDVSAKIFKFPEGDDMKQFKDKYDRVQEQLQNLAVMDDFLAGDCLIPL